MTMILYTPVSFCIVLYHPVSFCIIQYHPVPFVIIQYYPISFRIIQTEMLESFNRTFKSFMQKLKRRGDINYNLHYFTQL